MINSNFFLKLYTYWSVKCWSEGKSLLANNRENMVKRKNILLTFEVHNENNLAIINQVYNACQSISSFWFLILIRLFLWNIRYMWLKVYASTYQPKNLINPIQLNPITSQRGLVIGLIWVYFELPNYSCVRYQIDEFQT